MVTRPRPHDLLWLTSPFALAFDDQLPAWATPRWLAIAPVVVRRATAARGDALPVGVRGASRSERHAGWADPGDVLRVVEPEDVACSAVRSRPVRRSSLGCLRALVTLAPVLAESTLAWGVTGSVGFSLASGFDVLRVDSDLDLLLRAPTPAAASALRRIGSVLPGMPARVDVQVDTGIGAFALAEWLRTSGPVLMKTNAGPRLADDPWVGA